MSVVVRWSEQAPCPGAKDGDCDSMFDAPRPTISARRTLTRGDPHEAEGTEERRPMQHEETTRQIIGCAYRVYNRMGFGFLESVYENCLRIELEKAGLAVEPQKPITVYYEGEIVGEFVADLLVQGEVLVELKSLRRLAPIHEVRLVNYLVPTRKDVGLLINFCEEKVEVKRKAYERRVSP